jgi:quaternary ammonium compound-resistance protein SugE
LLFILVIATQIVGGIFLPKTEAFRNLPWTAACIGTYVLSFWAMALMIQRGTPLSMLLPFMAAVVPLALIGVGVWVYGEPASWAKLSVLTAACALIGVAGMIK